MSYKLILSDKAKEDFALFKLSGQKWVVKEIEKILEELKEKPCTGIGEPLKYELLNCWYRKISPRHRMKYKIIDRQVIVESFGYNLPYSSHIRCNSSVSKLFSYGSFFLQRFSTPFS